MKENKLYYKTLGLYFCHSAVSQLNLSFADIQRCNEGFTNPVDSKHAAYLGWSPKKSSIKNLDEIMPLLITNHERDHYIQLMSTPCGLLIWRVINSTITGISYAITKISDSDAKSTCYLPLTDWYFSIGKKAINDNPPNLPDVLIRKFGIDSALYKDFMPKYIEYVFQEIIILSEFQNALQDRSHLSMSEFVDLANRAFRFLKERSNLNINVEWTAHDLTAHSYLPKDGFSLNEIVEAGARFHENEILEGFEISENILHEWQNRSIFDVYKPVYEYLSSELCDPMLARLAIDISLMTPIDLSCTDAVSGRIYVEDVLPSWRLSKIVNAIKNAFWPNDRNEQELEARRNIAQRAGIPTPEQIIKAALSHPFSGERAWSGDAMIYDVPNEISPVEYFYYTEKEVKRAFQIRQSDCLAFIRPMEKPEIFQPAIEFYEDRAFFHCSPITERPNLLHLKIYMNLIHNFALMALMLDGDVSDLPRLHRSFLKRIALGSDSPDIKDLPDVKTILRNTFDPTIFQLLKW